MRISYNLAILQIHVRGHQRKLHGDPTGCIHRTRTWKPSKSLSAEGRNCGVLAKWICRRVLRIEVWHLPLRNMDVMKEYEHHGFNHINLKTHLGFTSLSNYFFFFFWKDEVGLHESYPFSWVLVNIPCWLVFDNCTQTRVTWEERILMEFLSTGWSVGADFLDCWLVSKSPLYCGWYHPWTYRTRLYKTGSWASGKHCFLEDVASLPASRFLSQDPTYLLPVKCKLK